MRKKIGSQADAIGAILKDEHFRFTREGKAFTNRTVTGRVSVNAVWRELTLLSDRGYRVVKYFDKRIRLHRIIYAKYKGELIEGLTINHIDGDKANNHVDNLEQVTQAENNLHAFRVLKRPSVYGNAKINKEIADVIRKDRRENKLKYSDLANKYKVCESTISYIINNKIWV